MSSLRTVAKKISIFFVERKAKKHSFYLQSFGAVWRLVSVACVWDTVVGSGMGGANEGAAEDNNPTSKMQLYREGWRNGLEDTSKLSDCIVTSALLSGLGMGKGEAYTKQSEL